MPRMYTMSDKLPGSAASTTFTVRVGRAVKQRLEKLAESTGRSRSFLAAEALKAYLDANERAVGSWGRSRAESRYRRTQRR